MPQTWRLSGKVLVTCNCDWGCPCNFNARPTTGKCEGGWTWHIDSGSYGDVTLNGLSFSVYANWPGAIHEGNGEAVTLIDERADEAQRTASAYMHDLRDPKAEDRLSANAFEKLLSMLSRFGPQPWLTPEKRAGYLEAWSPPGAFTGMLNWYRASPLLVPHPGEKVDAGKVMKLDPAQLRVRMPHLVIWGMNDQALLPVSRATLGDYCDDLTVREVKDADHWVVHQKTDAVIGLLRDFLQR